MKPTLESAAVDRLPSAGYAYNGSTAWEYRFVLQEEWSAAGDGLVELAPAGWVVVSFRTRLDNRREYLLKRPRR
jgi:hypothetical protein